jgi:hypothetical protein
VSAPELTDADEEWHSPAVDDPHWTETSYWGFYAPDRRLSGTIYNMWRPNLGIVASRVWVWDQHGDLPTDALYASMQEFLPIPEGVDPTDFELPTGLSVERIRALGSHRLRYSAGDALTIDVTTEALRPPVAAFHSAGEGTGHFDQHIRVTGSLTVWGEEVAIDCLSMRDRTWSMRPDNLGRERPMIAGYTHGARSADDCWLVMAVVPKTHLENRQPDPDEGADRTVALQAPAGAMVAIDGRLWHRTGANTTSDRTRAGSLRHVLVADLPAAGELVAFPRPIGPPARLRHAATAPRLRRERRLRPGQRTHARLTGEDSTDRSTDAGRPGRIRVIRSGAGCGTRQGGFGWVGRRSSRSTGTSRRRERPIASTSSGSTWTRTTTR